MSNNHSHNHSHSHNHDHDHGGLFHSHAPAGKMKQAFFLALTILVAELVFGFIANSLALLADAWHMATDSAAIGLAWFALVQAKKAANKRMTFGYERAGILAAAINGLTLVLITFWILYSAISRILNPEPVGGLWMMVGATIGILANLYIVFILSRGEGNLNTKAALLHVIGDVGASAGVIIAAIIIYFTGWQIVDPILSVLIAVIVAFTAWKIIKQTIGILMHATPNEINVDEVAAEIRKIEGVKGIHDLHIMSLTEGAHFLTCHIVITEDRKLSECQAILDAVEHALLHKGIKHTTIQLEHPGIGHVNELIYNHDFNEEHDHNHEH